MHKLSFVRQLLGIRRRAYHVLDRSESCAGTQEIQTLLKITYKSFTEQILKLSFDDVGFRRHSQFEEDGILLYIFSLIGETSRKAVEICCGDGQQSMAANLIVNHGWQGLLFEGDEALVKSARSFYMRQPDCLLNQPVIKQAWITAENINTLIAAEGYSGEVDLLSLDMDGNDYWVWKAIDVIAPRVCVFETHNVIPSHLALTMPYDPTFRIRKEHQDFRSASTLAMTKLSKEKGYRLIGAHRHGFNVFFMRNDIGTDIFPEISVESVHDNAFTRWSQANRWPNVKHLGWQEV